MNDGILAGLRPPDPDRGAAGTTRLGDELDRQRWRSLVTVGSDGPALSAADLSADKQLDLPLKLCFCSGRQAAPPTDKGRIIEVIEPH